MKYLSKGIGLVFVLALIASLPGAAQGSGYTAMMSVDSSGVQGDGSSFIPSISGDGRYVVFASRADNLVANDNNSADDAIIRDRKMNITGRVSVASDGTETDTGDVEAVVISANGRYVAFQSTATNLTTPPDSLGFSDVFVRDTKTNTTERVSVGTGGGEPDGSSYNASFSADGRYVAFHSEAGNLAAGDTLGKTDVFVYDRKKHTTERVSVGPGGLEGDDDSIYPAISDNGRYVAFQSAATNLLGTGADTNGISDVFVYDRNKHTTRRVSVGPGSAQATCPGACTGSTVPDISADGRYVAFQSSATDLVTGDSNDRDDVFVYDTKTGVTQRVSVGMGGTESDASSIEPSISGDGRFVAFTSDSTNLVTGDVNGALDIFVYDRKTGVTGMASVASDGSMANNHPSYYADISANGCYVAFNSDATNLATPDLGGMNDVFAVTNPVIIPRLASPANFAVLPSGRDKVKLSWRSLAGFKKSLTGGYEAQVATDSAFDPADIIKTYTGKRTSLQLKGLLPDTAYFWRVRTLLKGGYASTWAPVDEIQRFDTSMTAPPKLVKPRNGSVEKKANITLAWKRPKGAPKTTTYTLQYGTDPEFLDFMKYTKLKGLASTRYTITGLPVGSPPVVYYWRVLANSADGSMGYSMYSTTRTFMR